MLECHLLSNSMWSIWLWVIPSGEVQVYLWMFQWGNIMLLTTRYFDAAKFTILKTLSLLSWRRLSFPIVSLKMYVFPTFTLKSPNRIVIWYLENYRKPSTFPHTTVFWIETFLLTWCMRIQNKDITPAISQNYIWYPVLKTLCVYVK